MTPQTENRLWWAKFAVVLAVGLAMIIFLLAHDYKRAHRTHFTMEGASIARRTAWAVQDAYTWQSGYRHGLAQGRIERTLDVSQAYWDGCLAGMRSVPYDEYALRNLCSRLTSEARKP